MGETAPTEASLARRRAARGVVLLSLRTVLTQVLVLAGTIVLTRTLEPEDFGLFAVLQFALTFLQFFGDAGVGGALIQRPEAPSERALASVFTLQLLLGAGLVAAAWMAAPLLPLLWPSLPAVSTWLLRAMSVTFLVTAMRTIPSILLERGLRFGAIAAAEVGQVAGFYGVACACALAGLRAWTWPLALLAQALVGTLVVNAAGPWRPRLALDRALLGPLVRFGIPFQLKNLIGFANGAVTPVYAGMVLGPAPTGLITWGQQVASVPLRLVEVVARVSFPLVSRVSGDEDEVARVLERTLQACALGVFFAAALLLTAGPNVTVVIFSERWLGGVVALHAFSLALVVGFVSPVVGAVLDALGRPGVVARLAAGWTALNWIVIPLATARWGLGGFVYGYCVHVIVGNAAVLVAARTLVPRARLLRPLAGPALGALCVAAIGWTVLRPWATTPLRLVAGVAGALAVHLAVFAAVDPGAVRAARRLLGSGKAQA